MQKMSEKIISYYSGEKKSLEEADSYVKTHESVYRYLAYRDLPKIIKKYLVRGTALDYGSGTGYSAKFLQDLGFDVTGVDVCQEMLKLAQLKNPSVSFFCIEKDKVPLKSKGYDLVFSSFVLFEMNTKEKISKYLLEAKRLLKKDGLFVAVTGSQELYSVSREWLTAKARQSPNQELKSGSLVKLYVHEFDLEFSDYYWTERDYRDLFQGAELELVEVIYPLGKLDEPYLWKDEITKSPFVVFVVRHKT